MSKKLAYAGLAIAGLGLIVLLGAGVASGVDYRIAEDRGHPFPPTPPVLIVGFTIGLCTGIVGALVLVAAGVWALVTETRRR